MTIINLTENMDQNFLLLQFNNKKKILEKISPLFFLSLSHFHFLSLEIIKMFDLQFSITVKCYTRFTAYSLELIKNLE